MKQKYSDDEILEGMDKRLEENKQLLKGLQETVSPRWIPVEERLPEKGVSVLITTGDGEIGTDWIEGDEWFWGSRDYDVIAWMPLPEPYKLDD